MTNTNLRQWLGISLAGAFLANAIGCQPRYEITEVVLPAEVAALPTPPQLTTNTPRRMVVAMTEQGPASWFFKIEGPPVALAQSETDWTNFLRHVRFADNGQPSWDLPTGWQVLPPRPARFATLGIPADGGVLELAISSLPAGQDVLSNVNRWLGQLGRTEIQAEQLADRLRALPFANGEFLVFDEQVNAGSAVPTPNPPNEAQRVEPKFQIPDGWRFHQASPFVAASYLKEFQGETVQIAVSRMPTDAVSWPTVVEMWMEQVEPPTATRTDWEANARAVHIGGHPAQRIELLDAANGSRAGLIGVRVEVGADAWYFKVSGELSAVTAARDEFEALLDSVTFPQGE